jgi:hypothetical protein
MAPPPNRAAAPGKQEQRLDTVKASSWVDVHFKPPPLIGRIHFPTDSSKLDDDDMAQLEKMLNPYRQKLSLGKYVYFDYIGYCDFRAGKEYNLPLSQARADAVANYLGQPLRLGDYPSNYIYTSKGRGIDYNSLKEPANSADLSYYRRVDIHADPVLDDPPPRPDPPGLAVSNTWKARLYSSIGAGPPGPIPLAADILWLEIADLENNQAMSFKYWGIGVGKSFKGLPGISAGSSDWKNFKTMLKYNVMDFEGDAAHWATQLQVGAGYSMDAITLWGKSEKRITPRVRLEWEGWTKFDKAAGVGISVTAGMTLPDPKGQKPYWPTRIP